MSRSLCSRIKIVNGGVTRRNDTADPFVPLEIPGEITYPDFVLWCAAMWNLIRDERSGYESWKISVSCLLFALGIAAPAILSAALLIQLAG